MQESAHLHSWASAYGRSRLAALGVLTGALVGGCNQKAPPPPKVETRAAGNIVSALEGEGSIDATIQRNATPNDLHQIVLFYHQYQLANGRPPGGLDEFLDYMERDAQKLARALREGRLAIVYNVRNPGSNQIIAFETSADTEGVHYVAMGDATVHKLHGRDLRAALRPR